MNNPALEIAWVERHKVLSRRWLFQRPEFRKFSHEKEDKVGLELDRVETRPTASRVFTWRL